MQSLFGQMSIFDFLEEGTESFGVDIINRISKQIKDFLNPLNITAREKYEIWDHVPNLGKRYSCNFAAEYEDIVKFEDTYNRMVDECEAESLEIAISVTPYFGEKEGKCLKSVSVSTLWKRDKRNRKDCK